MIKFICFLLVAVFAIVSIALFSVNGTVGLISTVIAMGSYRAYNNVFKKIY